MRIEIFVVATKIAKMKNFDYSEFQKVKEGFTRLFGGLTQIPYFNGYWVNPKTKKIENDIGELWLIYTKSPNPFEIKREEFHKLLKQLKKLTNQKSQAYSIDNEMYHI